MAKYPLTLLPLVPVSHGHCQFPAPPGPVAERRYGTPAQVVAHWVGQQARWVHVLDLDAVSGHGDNHLAIASAVGTHLEVSGGIRDEHSLELALQSGCARVVIEPDDLDWAAGVVRRLGERASVAVRVRAATVESVLQAMSAAGAARYLAIDEAVPHHRFWHHEDRHLLADICQQASAPVTAMGGVATLEDLHALHELVGQGLDSIVLGDPLYDGSFTYAEAMAAGADRFDMFYWGPPS